MTQTISLVGSETVVSPGGQAYNGYASNASVATFANGGWVTTWQVQDVQNGSLDVYVQRFDASGTAIATAVRVNATVTANQKAPSAITLSDGRYVVTWAGTGPDGNFGLDQDGVYQRIYNADGTTSGPDQPVNATVQGTQESPSITAAPGGGWVVTWDVFNNNAYQVMQQAYTAAGVKSGVETQVSTTATGSQLYSKVTMLEGSSPGWLVTWQGTGTVDGQADTVGIFQQRYGTGGTPIGQEIRVNTSTAGTQDNAVVAQFHGNGGGWVVVWRDQSSAHRGIFQQVFDNYGGRVGGETQVSSAVTVAAVGVPNVTMLGNGRWVVTWSALTDTGTGIQSDVFQQVFNHDGTKNGSEMKVNGLSSLQQGNPSVVMLGADDWMVTWDGNGTGANAAISSGIFEQRFHLQNIAPESITLAGTAAVSYSGTLGNNFDFGKLATIDANGDTVFTYELVDNAGTSRFDIIGDAILGYHLALKNGVTLDSSSNPQNRNFSFNVKVTDQGGASFVQTLSFTGSNGNSTPGTIKVGGATALDIFEWGIPGRDIGVLSAADPDGVSVLTYAIVDQGGNLLPDSPFDVAAGDAAGSFKLKLKNGVMLDREAYLNGEFTLYVRVTDQGGHTTFEPIQVTVGNVPEAPTAITILGPASFSENAGTLIIETLLPVGGDKGTYTYSLISTAAEDDNNPSASDLALLFAINGQNLNKIGTFDYEKYTGGTFTFKLHAEIVGVSGTAFDQTVVVIIDDVNEAPTAIDFGQAGAVQANVLSKAAHDNVIGTLRTLDPDVGDTHNYTIVTGQGDPTAAPANGPFKISADKLVVDNTVALSALNGNQTVWIMSTDADGLNTWTAFTLTVTDDPPPTDILVTGGSVAEASAIGTVVASLETVDNVGDHHTYTLVADLEGGVLPASGHSLFEIRPGDDTIRLKAAVDDADVGSYDLFVATTDDFGNRYIEKVTVKVTNEPEAPTELRFSGALVAELAASGKVVGSLTTIDPDAAGAYTYSLVDDAGGRFAVQGDKIVVKNGFLLDHEQARSHTVTVHVTDETGLSLDKSFVITVGDVAKESTAGSAGNDVFFGGAQNDTLSGAAGNDRLMGGGGSDILKREAGNDTIGGGDGTDKLYGGTGGASKDLFVFDTKLSSAKIAKNAKDVIYDFGPKYDTLGFDDGVFTNKTISTFIKAKHGSTLDHMVKMDRKFIAFGDHALDRDDFFVYNQANGKLYWDVDGSGGKAQVEIATIKLEKNAGLITASDFYFV